MTSLQRRRPAPRLPCALLLLATIAADASAQRSGARVVTRVEPAVVPLEGVLYPMLLAAHGRDVIVYDEAERRVVRVRPDGRIAWAHGREGSGPGEFRRVTDLAVDAQGRLLVADAENARLTLIGADGSLLGSVAVGQPALRVEPATGTTVLLVQLPLPLFDRFDIETRQFTPLPRPPGLSMDARDMVAQDFHSATTSDGTVVAAFVYASYLAVLDSGLARARLVQTIDSQPWPPRGGGDDAPGPRGERTISSLPRSARVLQGDVTAMGRHVWILAALRGSPSGQVLDLYEPGTFAYRCSLAAPRWYTAIAASDSALFLLRHDPEPALEQLSRAALRRAGCAPD